MEANSLNEDKNRTNPLLGALEGFNKSSLKKTDVRVVTMTGKQFVEKKGIDGNFFKVIDEMDRRQYGFVAWGEPDLQVGEVDDGLIIGIPFKDI